MTKSIFVKMPCKIYHYVLVACNLASNWPCTVLHAARLSQQMHVYVRHLIVVRGHLQTDFGTLNVIMTLTFEPPSPLLNVTLKQCIDTKIMLLKHTTCARS